jgi:hypothetical protein
MPISHTAQVEDCPIQISENDFVDVWRKTAVGSNYDF